jgi:adenine deaminase
MAVRAFAQTPEELSNLLAVARGEREADLVLRGGRLVNVLSGEIYEAEVVLSGGRIAAVSREAGVYRAREAIDLAGEYIAPGFIDGHVHIESSLCVPAEFANAVLPTGTTSIVSDPHEIANVHGLDGIRFMLRASEGLPLRVFVMLSSCVPATDMETSGASLPASDLAAFLEEPRVLGIAEMMNFPGVITGNHDMVEKALLGHRARVPVDGHAPLLGGAGLQAYAAAGITSDHESVSAPEALDKLRAGIHILIREGSTAKNLDSLISIVNERTAPHCSFATDDKQPDDLAREGHIDHAIRKAIAHGVDPVTALSMATINTSRHYGLNDLGAVAPGYHADLVTFDDLANVKVTRVFAGGTLVAQAGQMLVKCRSDVPHPPNSVRASRLEPSAFSIPVRGKGFPSGSRVRVIGAWPDQLVTTSEEAEITGSNGLAISDPGRDILKIAVVERHRGTGNIGLGFVRGMGLKSGAFASTVAHDSHNIVAVGCTDEEMALAARTVIDMGGGICAVHGSDVLAALPLPVAGLMSPEPWESVRAAMERLLAASRHLGCSLSNPYMAMAFLALPVIPALKITDMGLVDVGKFSIVPLFIDN